MNKEKLIADLELVWDVMDRSYYSDKEEAAFERVKAEIITRAAPQWISVKDDGPPKEFGDYRIYPTIELQNYYSEAEYNPKTDKWMIEEYNSWGSDIFHPEPTHWMPLPLLPKEPD